MEYAVLELLAHVTEINIFANIKVAITSHLEVVNEATAYSVQTVPQIM